MDLGNIFSDYGDPCLLGLDWYYLLSCSGVTLDEKNTVLTVRLWL